ncbi:MAG: nucleotide sugar dehydrogenase [Chloroflexi bacterium]|nr:nucleotide sugar dehydrogenase [Chloroflexota bacterium]
MCVVGLGKIGLALAAQYTARGHRVIGCDINAHVVDTVNRGDVPESSEEGLAERVRTAHDDRRLSATLDTSAAAAESEVVVIIVPLLVDQQGQPDFRALDAATWAIAAGLKPGTLVLYETTLPLGTTRARFGPMLESSGLRMGRDFYLAFSPERVYVGRTFEDLRRYPKVVGGVTGEATDRAVAFYTSTLDAEIIAVQDAETAEFVKLAETTYRDVNIALANEFAQFAQARGIDAVAAFAAANTQPYSHIHAPGVGVGGHCIPVYPRFLLAQANPSELKIVRQARSTNDSMATYAVDLLTGELGSLHGRRVLILGLAYRGGVKEASCSSAILLISALREEGAIPLLHDPLFTDEEIQAYGVASVSLDAPVQADAVVLQADHPEYEHLDWGNITGCTAVLDGRGALDPAQVAQRGMTYLGVGRGFQASNSERPRR